MNRLGFLLAKLTGDETTLCQLSADSEVVNADLRGRTVALVGNARSLSETDHGAAIDSAELVIRINRAPLPSVTSHGRRTDWLATSMSVTTRRFAELSPTRLLWMAPHRKRLSWRLAHSPGFYLYPAAGHAALLAALGARPSTGIMVLDLLRASSARRIDIFGFDFFVSLSLSGHRDASQVPHDFDRERDWVEALMASDDRFHLHPTTSADRSVAAPKGTSDG
jgi:hypothetical protein